MPSPEDTLITRYLLGSLSDAETERLDELSIGDDQFAEDLKAAEADLVDAYAGGELTGDERARFESHYQTSPARRERVAFASAFRDWAEKQSAPPAVEPAPEKADVRRRTAGWFSGKGIGRAPRWAWGFAVVALLLLLGGGILIRQNLQLRRQMAETEARRDEVVQRENELRKQLDDQRSENEATAQELAQLQAERERLERELNKPGVPTPNLPSSPALIMAPPTRGGGAAPSVHLTTNLINAQLGLEPGADFAVYRVALIDPANQRSLWQSRDLKPVAKPGGKAIFVSFPGTLLQQKTYLLRVSGRSADNKSEIIGDYPIQVVK